MLNTVIFIIIAAVAIYLMATFEPESARQKRLLLLKHEREIKELTDRIFRHMQLTGSIIDILKDNGMIDPDYKWYRDMLDKAEYYSEIQPSGKSKAEQLTLSSRIRALESTLVRLKVLEEGYDWKEARNDRFTEEIKSRKEKIEKRKSA